MKRRLSCSIANRLEHTTHSSRRFCAAATNVRTDELLPANFTEHLNNVLSSFPIEMKKTETFGRGLYAARDIDLGETVLMEEPVYYFGQDIIDRHPDLEFDKYAQANHERESFSIEEAGTMVCLKELLSRKGHEHLHSTFEFLLPNYYDCDPRALRDMRSHLFKTHTDLMLRVGRDKANTIIEHVHKVLLANVITSVRRSGEIVGGLFPLASIFNHSCTNNIMAVPEEEGPAMSFVAMAKIDEGQQFYHSYNPDQNALHRIFGIPCNPEDCACNKDMSQLGFCKVAMNLILRGAVGTNPDGTFDEKVDWPSWFIDRLGTIKALHEEMEKGNLHKFLDMRGTNVSGKLDKRVLKFASKAKARLILAMPLET